MSSQKTALGRDGQGAPTGVIGSFRFAFSSPRRLRIEVLGGLVVALALIPESIAFSVLAGVDPRMGLFASVIMAIVISFTGGRPAMISAATGAVAVVIAPIAREYGVEYFIATVLLAGVFQIVLSVLGVAKLMRFIPRSVMIGFMNSLAIIVFSAQVPHLIGVPWLVYPMCALGLVIMVGFPRLTTAIPAPLVTIIILTSVTIAFGVNIPTVSDQGELPDSLPQFLIPNVPITTETFAIIAPAALAMALVGLMESLLTAKLVDDIADNHSDKTREAWGQGVANIVTGFFGGMGGCAMIGQTLINVRESQARTRLSTFLAGLFLLILILSLGDIVGMIPMAALVAVMIIVAAMSFDWRSVSPQTLRLMPVSESAVMVTTVAATLLTRNLAIGVAVGVLSAMVMFARRVAHVLDVTKITAEEDPRTVTYKVDGQLFFASSNDLVYAFDYTDDVDSVLIDLNAARIWDASTVAALDSVIQKFGDRGVAVHIIGLDGPSKQRLDKLSGKLG